MSGDLVEKPSEPKTSIQKDICKPMTSSIARLWPQWLAGIATSFLLIEVGLVGGWTSPYLAKLMADDSSLPITAEEASWIASLMNFSRLFGGIFGAFGCGIVGSKMTCLLTIVPAALGWIFTILADSAMWLYIARLSGGVALGMAFGCFPLYLGEIADPETRGALVTLAITGAPVGNALVSLIGSIFDMVESSIAFFVASILLILIFIMLPESPHHLIKRSKIQSAKDSIAWYHRGCDVEAEYAALDKFMASSNTMTFRESLGEFRRPEIKRATFVILTLYMFMQMSGLNNIILYMATILTHAKVTMIDPSMCATIVMSFGIIASVASVNLMDRLGRRALLICSSIILATGLTLLEIHFSLLEAGYESMTLQWLPIIALILAEVAIFLGITPVPSTVLSELFPSNIKCIASCGAGTMSAIFGFLCTKTYQPLIDIMGEQYVYWIYIVIELLATPFALFIMPETKGKSLQQIQDELTTGKSKDQCSDKV